MTPILDQYLCATWYVAVCSAAEGALAPMGGEEGRGIPWRPPAYSLFHKDRFQKSVIILSVI